MTFQPTVDVPSAAGSEAKISLKFPGFSVPPNHKLKADSNSLREIFVIPANLPIGGINPSEAYNTLENPLFEPLTYFDINTYDLALNIAIDKTMKAGVYTNTVLCCFILPVTIPPCPDPLCKEKF
jgi:hypothetical protein